MYSPYQSDNINNEERSDMEVLYTPDFDKIFVNVPQDTSARVGSSQANGVALQQLQQFTDQQQQYQQQMQQSQPQQIPLPHQISPQPRPSTPQDVMQPQRAQSALGWQRQNTRQRPRQRHPSRHQQNQVQQLPQHQHQMAQAHLQPSQPSLYHQLVQPPTQLPQSQHQHQLPLSQPQLPQPQPQSQPQPPQPQTQLSQPQPQLQQNQPQLPQPQLQPQQPPQLVYLQHRLSQQPLLAGQHQQQIQSQNHQQQRWSPLQQSQYCCHYRATSPAVNTAYTSVPSPNMLVHNFPATTRPTQRCPSTSIPLPSIANPVRLTTPGSVATPTGYMPSQMPMSVPNVVPTSVPTSLPTPPTASLNSVPMSAPVSFLPPNRGPNRSQTSVLAQSLESTPARAPNSLPPLGPTQTFAPAPPPAQASVLASAAQSRPNSSSYDATSQVTEPKSRNEAIQVNLNRPRADAGTNTSFEMIDAGTQCNLYEEIKEKEREETRRREPLNPPTNVFRFKITPKRKRPPQSPPKVVLEQEDSSSAEDEIDIMA